MNGLWEVSLRPLTFGVVCYAAEDFLKSLHRGHSQHYRQYRSHVGSPKQVPLSTQMQVGSGKRDSLSLREEQTIVGTL